MLASLVHLMTLTANRFSIDGKKIYGKPCLRVITMINFLKKGIQIVNEELAQYEQLRVDAENEYLAMNCGAFNTRLLAKIKRSKDGNNTNNNKEQQRIVMNSYPVKVMI